MRTLNPMTRPNRAPLLAFVSALGGGAIVAVLLVAFGAVGSDTTKTVVQQAPLSKPVQQGSGRGLTARDIYKRDAPGVAFIRATIVQQSQSPFDFGPQTQQGTATGSGFVIDRSGDILTNAHVVAGATKISVSFGNKESVPAKVVGRDVSNDLALIKVDPSGLNLKPLTLGDARTVQVGDPTIAIGNPFGLDRTLTTGVVSALQRKIQAPNGFAISNVIQTDAAINPGNSGGPLLDAAGRVIGINSQIETGGDTQGNVGIGFAVPINTAKRVVPQLKRSGTVQRAYLGITGLTIDKSLDRLNLSTNSGVLVQSVQPRSPAAKSGLKGGDTQANLDGSDIALGGDVIKKIDGRDVKSMDDVVAVVDAKKPGDTVSLQVIRNGGPRTITIRLGQRPSQAPQQ